MTYETIIYDVSDSVATITLNRTENYNALNPDLLRELLAALTAAEADASVRAIIVTGSGKGFCSGADLAAVGEGLDIGQALRDGFNPVILKMRSLPKPIVCALNGVAAGAGAGLALAADFRVASDQATFVFAAFVGIGLVPDAGVTYLLQQIVGQARALELCLLAGPQQRLDASGAQALGIVTRVVAHDDLQARAQSLAAKLALMPTRAIGYTKQAIYGAADRTLAEALEYEAELQTAAFKTRDFQEGLAAFLEKREPVFTGE